MAVPISAHEVHLSQYLKFLQEHPQALGAHGNYKAGEIEVVTDEKKIKEIEEIQRVRCLKLGMTEEEAFEASRVGIISSDQYWFWIRDAVIFPTGAEGTFNRILKNNLVERGKPGVAVLPVLPDGRIVLNLNFRHATRSWQLELPRGNSDDDEETTATVARELKEETGLCLSSCHFLGKISPDSGCLSTVVPVYLGKVDKKGLSSPDFSEAILRIEAFELEKVKEALAQGYMIMDVKGKKEKVKVYDPFLAFALFQAEYKKLF